MAAGILFIVSGPSGVGKTTLISRALHDTTLPCPLEKLVSYTTKAPRATEVDGLDYHFITQEEFKRLETQHFFAETVAFYGNYYGIAQQALERLQSGISMVTVINQQGAARLSRLYPHVIGIWIDTPSIAVLAERLRLRDTDTKEQQELRIASAPMEIYKSRHSPFYKYRIINNIFDVAYSDLIAILKKELTIC